MPARRLDARTAALCALSVAVAVVVYRRVPHGYFFGGDFVNLYALVNAPPLDYLLHPHGGHLLVLRNLVTAGFHAAFGLVAQRWFAVVLVTHLLNTVLLFDVLRRLGGSARIACLGAGLWAISPSHGGALGWFSVYGQVLATTLVLVVLRRLARSGARPDAAPSVAGSVLLLAAASQCFGIGIGVVMVAPVVAFLLLPPGGTRRRTVAAFVALAAVMPVVYVALTRLYFALYPSPSQVLTQVALHTALDGWHAKVAMLPALAGYGTDALVLGGLVSRVSFPGAVALAVCASAALLVVAALVRGPAAMRRRVLAALVLVGGVYGIIALGRGPFFTNDPGSVSADRYHYGGQAALALALGLAAATLVRERRAAAAGDALVAAALVAAVGVRVTLGPAFDEHTNVRRLTEQTLRRIVHTVKTTPGDPVYVANTRFAGVGPMFIDLPDRFPGAAGLFAVAFPTNVVAGKEVRFVEPRGEVRAAVADGRRTAGLLVPARTVRVAGIQLAGVPGDVEANVAHAIALIERAAAEGAEYVLLPELYALFPAARDGRPTDEIRAEAQPVDGPLTARLQQTADRLGVHIAAGMSERRGDEVYNSLVLIEPGGVAGAYAKRALVAWPSPVPDRQGQSEATIFATGRRPGVFQWGALKAGTVVCADGSFDTFWKQMMAQKPELVLWASSSLGSPPGGVEETAQERGVPIVYVNRPRMMVIGDEERQLGGLSRVVDAEGRILGKLGNEMDGILIVDVPVAPRSLLPSPPP
jgi:predicted amidohydrolase